MTKHFKVETLKTRLDKYLSSQMPEFSRNRIQQCIELGLVLVNGRAVFEAKQVVRLGDQVSFTKDQQSKLQPPKDLPVETIFENEDLLVLDKPAGFSVHPGAGFKGDSLTQMLVFRYPRITKVGEAHRPGIVHRLDKDTSGCLLVAKTSEMYEYLKKAFEGRSVKKQYIALVYGRIEKTLRLDKPMGKSKLDFRKVTTLDPKEAKGALTEVIPLEHLKIDRRTVRGSLVDEVTLILVKLHTGRTHQIRVHLESIGAPLVGDELYGGKGAKFAGLQRHFLHARSLGVQLPDSSWIEVESKLPSDLRAVLKTLGSKKLDQL